MAEGTDRRPSISVIVPVYDGEATLTELADRLQAVLARLSSDHEVILVNDGSRDASWSVIQRLSSERRRMIGIDLMRNYGQHNALLVGIRAATMELIVTLDDDLQHSPEDIPLLVAKLDEGHDVVYGTSISGRHGLFRDLASAIVKLALQATMGAEAARSISPFRAFRREVREGFTDYRGHYVNIDVLLTWGTSRISSVPVIQQRREHGGSGYSTPRLLAHAFNMVTGFSSFPLHLASIAGFALTGFGGILLLYVFGRFIIEGGSVPGFPFLASIIVIFSGAQLAALGIIGQYLARIHFRTMDRPPYAVRATTTALEDPFAHADRTRTSRRHPNDPADA